MRNYLWSLPVGLRHIQLPTSPLSSPFPCSLLFAVRRRGCRSAAVSRVSFVHHTHHFWGIAFSLCQLASDTNSFLYLTSHVYSLMCCWLVMESVGVVGRGTESSVGREQSLFNHNALGNCLWSLPVGLRYKQLYISHLSYQFPLLLLFEVSWSGGSSFIAGRRVVGRVGVIRREISPAH